MKFAYDFDVFFVCVCVCACCRQPGAQRISVCVRKRPLTCTERRTGEADVVTALSGACVIVHESKEAVDLTEYILQVDIMSPEGTVTTSSDQCADVPVCFVYLTHCPDTLLSLQHRFYFDQVFGEESSNEEVYRRTAYPLVQHMLNG